jgi:hypothetical protein
MTYSKPYELYLLRGGKGKAKDKCYIGITNKGVLVRVDEHNGLSSVSGAKDTEKWRPWSVYAVVKGTPGNPLGKLDALALEHMLQQPRTPRGIMMGRRYQKGLRNYDSVLKDVIKLTKPYPRSLFPSNLAFRKRMLELVLSVKYFKKLSLRVEYADDAKLPAHPVHAPLAHAHPAHAPPSAAVVVVLDDSPEGSVIDLTGN